MTHPLPFPQVSPAIFSFDIAGIEIALRWYGTAYMVGLVLAMTLARHLLATPRLWPGGKAPMSREQLLGLLLFSIVGVVLGGRLGSAIFYTPGKFLDEPLALLRVWEGGMSFHGGLLGVVLAGLIVSRSYGLAWRSVGDLAACVAPAGLFLGRIANFINAELWGRPTDLPWAVAFPGPQAQACGQPAEVLCGRHPSQLYEAGLEGLALGILLWVLVSRGALMRPGQAMGVFLAGYGICRVAVEMVREPDAVFHSLTNPAGYVLALGETGLTQGQLLSLPMVVMGAILIFRATATSVPRPCPKPSRQ